MASEAAEEGGGGVAASSLFEGMVLFDASDLLPVPSSPTPPASVPPPSPPAVPDAAPASAAPSAPSPSSQPLDEDLFSDLTVLTPPAPPLQRAPLSASSSSSLELPVQPPATVPPDLPSPSARSAATPETPPLGPPARQISRKKKRAIRIGYGRGPATGWLGGSAAAVPAEDEPDSEPSPLSLPEAYSYSQQQQQRQRDLAAGSSSPSSLRSDSSPSPLPSLSPSSVALTAIESRPVVAIDGNSLPSDDTPDEEADRIVEEERVGDHHPSKETREEKEGEQQQQQERQSAPPPEPEENGEDAVASVEGKLERIRAQISEKLSAIKKSVALLSEERKVLRRRRREAADSMHAVSVTHKELERELEEACVVEDFEKAERVSESLAAAEKEKDDLLRVLRGVEEDYDAVDSKMQEVLEMQISVEEDGAVLLEQFSKDAADSADLVIKDATKICSEEIKVWQSSVENLEARKLEMDIQSHVVDEARAGLVNSIEQLTEDDSREKEMLSKKGDLLAKELCELLALVKQKEAQIVENNAQIQEVEERISRVVSEFQETQSNIDAKYSDLQSVLSEIESEGKSLLQKKKEIDESLDLAEQKSTRLKELANVSLEEVKTFHNLVSQRKDMASYVLKSREEKVRLARIEEKILEEIQILQQQISSARSSLQDLSLSRANIQEAIALLKQRISFIDKRGPELEAEKKVAAAARNFKEAGRIAAEAKALSLEKENVQLEYEKGISDLEKVEEDIRNIIDGIQEGEVLILSKEKEAAIARCERLCLVAATARAEQSAAIASGDSEEGDILLLEAEAAESEVRELQQKYDFELDRLATIPKCSLSIPIITNLSIETASSFSLPLASGS